MTRVAISANSPCVVTYPRELPGDGGGEGGGGVAVTVKFVVLKAAPVILMGPVVALTGTVAVIFVSEMMENVDDQGWLGSAASSLSSVSIRGV